MQRADEEARRMRHDEADETDRADHADDRRGHHRRQGEQHDPRLTDVDAERRGRLVPEGKGIQHTGIEQAGDKAEADDDRDKHELRPAHAAETAEQPEHHVTRLLGIAGGRHDVGGGGVEELRGGNSCQDGAVRPATRAVREQRDE